MFFQRPARFDASRDGDSDYASVVLLLDNTKRDNAETDSDFAGVVLLLDNTKG